MSQQLQIQIYFRPRVLCIWPVHVPTTTKQNIFEATCSMYMVSTCPNNYRKEYISGHISSWLYVYYVWSAQHLSTCPNNYRKEYISGHVYYVWSAHVQTTTEPKQFIFMQPGQVSIFFLSFIRQECIRFRITYSLSGGGREDFKTFLGSFNVRDKNHITYLHYKCIQCTYKHPPVNR